MSKRPTTTSITNIDSSAGIINNNFDAVGDAFENTISRDGSTPNQMEADLDLNGNDLLNVGDLTTAEGVSLNDLLSQLTDYISEAEESAESAATSAAAAESAKEAIDESYGAILYVYTDRDELEANIISYGDGTVHSTRKEGYSYVENSSDPDITINGVGLEVPDLGTVTDAWFFTATDEDDTEGLQTYFDWCEDKWRPVRLVQGRYTITDTITSNVRMIDGSAEYIDSGNPGTRIRFEPETLTDLKPAIQIVSGMNRSGQVRGIAIVGTEIYDMDDAETWCPYPEILPSYDAFLEGAVGFEIIGGNQPSFHNCSTKQVKVGRLDNSEKGHVFSWNSAWKGWLAGVYCIKNSEGYRFYEGTIAGVFANYIFGTKTWANHKGGVAVFMYTTHMGFAPYGFYQVNDDDIDLETETVTGIYGIINARLEDIGECAIQTLPNANVTGLDLQHVGFSWSDSYRLHTSIMDTADQQQYALRLGSVSERIRLSAPGETHPFRSSPYAATPMGILYIEELATEAIEWANSDFSGVYNDIVVGSFGGNSERTLMRSGDGVRRGDMQLRGGFQTPNLINSPEDAGNWNAATVTITDFDTVGIDAPQQFFDELGDNPTVIQLPASDGGNVRFSTDPFPAQPNRTIGFSLWFCGPSICRSRLTNLSGTYYYDDTKPAQETLWTKREVQGKSFEDDLRAIEIITNSSGVLYVAGVTVFLDDVKPYNPSPYHSLTSATTDTTAPSAGAADALPATPAGYITINIDGVDRQIAYY